MWRAEQFGSCLSCSLSPTLSLSLSLARSLSGSQPPVDASPLVAVTVQLAESEAARRLFNLFKRPAVVLVVVGGAGMGVRLRHDVIVFQARPRSLQSAAVECHLALETGCNKKLRTLGVIARRKVVGGGGIWAAPLVFFITH